MYCLKERNELPSTKKITVAFCPYVTADLEVMMWQARQEASAAAAAAEEAGHRDVTAQHHAGSSLTAVKERVRAVLDALKALTKLALRTSAAMQSATFALQTAPHAAPDQVRAALLC